MYKFGQTLKMCIGNHGIGKNGHKFKLYIKGGFNLLYFQSKFANN